MSAAAAAGRSADLTARRRAVFVPVVAGAAAVIVVAAHALAVAPPEGGHSLLGIAALLVLAGLLMRYPLPLRDGREMLLAGVPLVCSAVLYGAAVTALMGFAVFVAHGVTTRPTAARFVYNTAVWTLMAGAAGAAAHVRIGGDAGLIAAVVLSAGAIAATNIALVALMVEEGHLRETVMAAWSEAKLVAGPVALSLSLVPLFAVAWPAHPLPALFAFGPLAAVALYMRSQSAAREAALHALTDSLTGLGNRRGFEQRVERELDRSDDTGMPVSLCLLDLDGFKAINDTSGHEEGDRSLTAVAAVLRRDGEAFRYGGDEFVLLLPGRTRAEAETIAGAVQARVRALDDGTAPLSVTVGVATYPEDGMDRGALVRSADEMLYRRKRGTPALP